MKKFIAPIVEIRQETLDVRTFRLENTGQISFIPGQYCLVSLPDHPRLSKTNRPFTFSNSPTITSVLDLTIKQMGEFTNELFDLKPGDKLEIKGPRGEALNFTDNITQDIVLLAGGSGITPFMSIIRYCLIKKLAPRLTLLFGNRTTEDIIFEEELKHLAGHQLRVVHVLEQPKTGWNGEHGRISRQLIEKYVTQPVSKLWYLCGPPGMMTAMKNILIAMHIPETQWRWEPWELPGKNTTTTKM